MTKVAPLLMCLCRLHNYCINHNEFECGRVDDAHWQHLHREVADYQDAEQGTATIVTLSQRGGRPDSLLDAGHHFLDAEHNRIPDSHTPMDKMMEQVKKSETPMDEMMTQVKKKNLQRPKIRSVSLS